MDNLRKTIEVLFRDIDSEKLLKQLFGIDSQERFLYDNVDKFVQRFDSVDNSRSIDEVEAVGDMLCSSWSESNCDYSYKKKDKSVFNVLTEFTKQVITEEDGEPKCRFEQLLRWRDLSLKLGEDIFTTAYFAEKDIYFHVQRSSFCWHPVIISDNKVIDNILQRGTTELHHHLKGSSSHFNLSWLSLMNNISGRSSEFKDLKKFKKTVISITDENTEKELYFSVIKAAAIRAYLFSKYICHEKDCDEKLIIDILKSENRSEVRLYVRELQTKVIKNLIINSRFKAWNKNVDYAIGNIEVRDLSSEKSNKYLGNIALSGERFFMYNILKEIYKNTGNEPLQTLFHVYLVIKSKFRSEMIQTNEKLGFTNFQEYQNRKSYFIKDNSIYESLLYNMAVQNVFVRGNVTYLETRIAPKDTSIANIKTIKNIDKAILDKRFTKYKDGLDDYGNIKDESFKENYYYIFHFIKRADKKVRNRSQKENISMLDCGVPRNNQCRKSVKKQAIALNNMRKKSNLTRKRVVGIDSASSEFGCRAEVFAQAYRYLKGYDFNSELKFLINYTFPKLGFTFHAGEDYYDIVDGLRAIDETIRFLNFGRGDRIGHALALGVDTKDFYEMKHYKILISRQELLDNVAWLLVTISRYDIIVNSSLKSFLKNTFYDNCQDIFSKQIDLDTYFNSYCLRGDMPRLYMKDNAVEYLKSPNPVSYWYRVGLNCDESAIRARHDEKAIRLYRDYHYNDRVKENGRCFVEFKVCNDYIKMVGDIQKALAFDLSEKGVVIETNPSSNHLISSYKYYAKHPIFNFFNTGLVNKEELLRVNPQLSVSINTDDSGVFATSIENEYAMLAVALHKEKIHKDCFYNDRYIYDWLDRIRVMGFEQSFRK